MDLIHVLKRPLVTEKSTLSLSKGKYAFEVDRRATKKEIIKAIEDTYGVHIIRVQTITGRGKKRKIGRTRIEIRQPDWKKTVVQLAEGEKIDIFETGT
ncbi:50S ribosomal protein L23 [Candidatus Shapirobacteria bacterium CG_4_9_14_0_2_um_filter_39_11]|uniref:Large ribosomal subunit protein uL23 n=1 Tax=Candidatus Shapirobacteria bacterium CG_4_9_14_0_2_um_filter_39_11 TaxID=1974478 RepID=A0A2M8ESR6_9BACT|nr:MAG: 50S ribosomal protein L23 [Candidatus Shapirobacteria bacterium CG_4_9_14_0_2_um_filter_39_11]